VINALIVQIKCHLKYDCRGGYRRGDAAAEEGAGKGAARGGRAMGDGARLRRDGTNRGGAAKMRAICGGQRANPRCLGDCLSATRLARMS